MRFTELAFLAGMESQLPHVLGLPEGLRFSKCSYAYLRREAGRVVALAAEHGVRVGDWRAFGANWLAYAQRGFDASGEMTSEQITLADSACHPYALDTTINSRSRTQVTIND